MLRFIHSQPAKRIMNFILAGLVVASLSFIITSSKYGIIIWTFLVGLLGIVRPRFILDIFEEESKRKDLEISPPVTGEKSCKFIGYAGGGFLIIISLIDFIALLIQKKTLFF